MFGFSSSSSVDVQQAYDSLGANGHVLIDVRTPGEVQEQGIAGAVNVPLDRLEQAAPKLAGYSSVHVICRSGSRSAMATQMLHSLGITQAKNVSGGMIAWAQAGLPTV